jgi:hypothetical protein
MQADESDIAFDPPIGDAVSFRELHAFVDGVYCGVVNAREHEYGQQKHYWRAGWLVGDAYDRWVRR